MDYQLELSKENRNRIANVFDQNKRVDYSIDCVVEGKAGKAFVDDPLHPAAYCINIGPFWYFAGNTHGPGGRRLIDRKSFADQAEYYIAAPYRA